MGGGERGGAAEGGGVSGSYLANWTGDLKWLRESRRRRKSMWDEGVTFGERQVGAVVLSRDGGLGRWGGGEVGR